jgi:hypothetical protein
MFLVFVETYPAIPKGLNNFLVEESIYSFLKLLSEENVHVQYMVVHTKNIQTLKLVRTIQKTGFTKYSQGTTI